MIKGFSGIIGANRNYDKSFVYMRKAEFLKNLMIKGFSGIIGANRNYDKSFVYMSRQYLPFDNGSVYVPGYGQ